MGSVQLRWVRNLSAGIVAVAMLVASSSVALAATTPKPVPASGYCSDLAKRLGGIPVPNGDVCDVVVVRKSPTIRGKDGMNLNKFTLMNSVLEFTKTGMPKDHVHVMGDFALLETELNKVLKALTDNKWTVTGVHNHMILESPKTTFVHWEAKGNLDTIVHHANLIFALTSIKKAAH